MQKKLGGIANIVTGYTFRDSLKSDLKGSILVLQARNISASHDISEFVDLPRISPESLRAPYFLEYNDILIVSRGSGIGAFRSSVFATHDKNVIASSSLHIIRVTDVTVLPKYVSLYLNSAEGQKALSQIVTGSSYIQSILLKNLNDLEIPIPPVHVQKSIVALHENITDQEKLWERKRKIQKNIINASFTKLTT